MFIDGNATLLLNSVRRSGGQRDIIPLNLVPLLRTELRGVDGCYRHLTLYGVKTLVTSLKRGANETQTDSAHLHPALALASLPLLSLPVPSFVHKPARALL